MVLFGRPPPGTSSISSTTSHSDRATIRFRTLLRRNGSGKCDLDRFLPMLPSTDPFLSFASALIRLLLWSCFSWRSGLRRRASGGSCRPMVVRARAEEIAFGQSSRSFLQASIEKLADDVGVTLGPRGTFVSSLSPRMFWWQVRPMTPQVMGRQLHLSLLTRSEISTIKKTIPLLEKMTQLTALLLIIAEDVTGRALATLVVNKLAEHSQCCGNKSTWIWGQEKGYPSGYCNFDRAEFQAKDLGLYIENVSVGQLGTAKIFTLTDLYNNNF